MAIMGGHVRWYEQIFALEGFLAEPTLLFGFQEIPIAARHFGWSVPETYRVPDLVQFLRARGLNQVHVIDHFDPRADLRYDMNKAVPPSEHERYGTLIDIGSLEHVFDTRQALENCLRMVRVGGTYLLHTCVKGYHLHGLHTFHPGILADALALNGFDVVFQGYSTADGEPVQDPAQAEDALIWLVGRKRTHLAEFVCPQQGWEQVYATDVPASPSRIARVLAPAKRALFPFVPPIALDIYRRLRGRRRDSLVERRLRREPAGE